jgi:hypothetical protein
LWMAQAIKRHTHPRESQHPTVLVSWHRAESRAIAV